MRNSQHGINLCVDFLMSNYHFLLSCCHSLSFSFSFLKSSCWHTVTNSLFFLSFFSLPKTAQTCGYPGSPAHAIVSMSPQGPIQSGTTATYNCDNGYELLGPARRTCNENGTWTPLGIPFCGKCSPFFAPYLPLLLSSFGVIYTTSKRLQRWMDRG